MGAGPQQVARADGHLRSSRANPAEHEVFSALLVVRAVDHRQSQDDGAAGEPVFLDVELLVVLRDALEPRTAVGVAVAT